MAPRGYLATLIDNLRIFDLNRIKLPSGLWFPVVCYFLDVSTVSTFILTGQVSPSHPEQSRKRETKTGGRATAEHERTRPTYALFHCISLRFCSGPMVGGILLVSFLGRPSYSIFSPTMPRPPRGWDWATPFTEADVGMLSNTDFLTGEVSVATT